MVTFETLAFVELSIRRFNFVRHYVTYVDTLSDGEKTRYLFQVNAPFDDTPGVAEVYAATFDFDAEGNFIDVYLQINILRDDAYTLTQSIATRPKLILADEPTGALDSKTSREIIDIFHELHNQGNTIVLITHDNNVAKQAQRSIHILDGQISEVKL